MTINDHFQMEKEMAAENMVASPKPLEIGAVSEAAMVGCRMEDRRRETKEVGCVGTEEIRSGGVYLTWKDLWVTATNVKGETRAILHGLTGYAQPGEVLAIMGPSGCGKSTLLDALAGRLGSNTNQTGKILVNGRKQDLGYGTSAYVTQDDTLMNTLTVREAVYYSAQLQVPDSMSKAEKQERAESTIREMGLHGTMNTRIGGCGVKGLSGGQKMRVSICIEILTRPKLLFLDEPTRGFDSAASYHVMSSIVGLAKHDKRTVIAAIHQPSYEVFELFHNLCLLSAGKAVFFGQASAANEFFAVNGFPCPSLKNPSDHYLRTINCDFDKDIEQGNDAHEISAAEAIRTLGNSYRSSHIAQQVSERVAEITKQISGEDRLTSPVNMSTTTEGPLLQKKGGQAGFITQAMVLTKRSFVNMYRDLGYYWLRLVIYIGLCVCVGTIFYNIGHSYKSIQIFGRERLNGHYDITAFVIANTFSSIPYLLLISLIPGAIAYHLVRSRTGIGHFAYFSLVLYLCMILVESLMMIVASIVPNFLMGIITGAGIQGFMMLNGGFFRLADDLPKPFWKYPMYYISFHKYANEGLYKNEFEGIVFINDLPLGPPTFTGEEILTNTWEVQMSYNKWVDIGILFGMIIFYRIMFLCIIKLTEKMKPIMRAILSRSPQQAAQVLHAELPNSSP